MDSRAQEIINQISALSGSFGVSVTVSRTVITPSTQRNAFGTPIGVTPIGVTPTTFSQNVIIESQKIDLTPTLAGGKAQELIKMISTAGVFKPGDEITYNAHKYKVNELQPVPFVGTDVVDFVHAAREVD